MRNKISFELFFEFENNLYENFASSIVALVAQMYRYNDNFRLIKLYQQRFQFDKILIRIYVIAFLNVDNILQCEFTIRFKIISMIFMNQFQKIQTQMSKIQIRNHLFAKIK